jgi:hypothetical protein
MVSCYPATFENGTDTRIYIDTALSGTPSWIKIGGETTSDLDIKPKTAEGDNKDSVGGLSLPVGYDWTMSAEAQWDLDDPGQVLIRAMPIGLITRRIAFKPSGSSTGYYGYCNVGWKVTAGNRAIQKMSITITGCGEITYA